MISDSDIFGLARGQWKSIITSVTNVSLNKLTNKHQPCPLCGGKDRYRFDDKDGQGTYYCNHCGAGNGYTLIKKYNNWDDQTTIIAIQKFLGIDENSFEPQVPAPENIVWDKSTLLNKPKKYNFKYCWDWLDESDRKIGYVTRFDLKDGKKIIWSILYGKGEQGLGWYQSSIKTNKPLFGLPTIQRSNVVLVVEGEKSQVIVSKIIQSIGVVAAQGGSQMVKKTDWSPLKDKEVIIWPDNDEAGLKYASDIKAILPKAKIIKPPEGKSKGWDLADAIEEGWTGEQIFDYMNKNVMEINKMDVSNELDLVKKLVRPLGHDKNEYFYCPVGHKQLITLSPNSHTKNSLLSLCDLDVWETTFPGKKEGFDSLRASNFLMKECRKQGIFKPEKIRGVGFWEDRSRIVINNGSELIVDDKELDFADIDSSFYYEQSNLKNWIDLNNPLLENELGYITKASVSIPWEHSINAEYLLGLIVSGPICGALDWRSHGWITGSAGTGKTTVTRDLIGSLWGDACIKVQGKTSEAGIRQQLGPNALPVLFDEAEPNEASDKKSIQSIIAIARQASSKGEFKIAKGTADHKGVSFNVTSSFIFSSINTALKYQADETRTLILGIDAHVERGVRDKMYKDFQDAVNHFDNNFSKRYIGFLAKNIKYIKENGKKVVQILKGKGFSPRLADQSGYILGAALILYFPNRTASDEEIDAYVSEYESDLMVQKNSIDGTQELDLLNSILDSLVMANMNDGNRQMPLRRIIKILKEKSRGYEDYDCKIKSNDPGSKI